MGNQMPENPSQEDGEEDWEGMPAELAANPERIGEIAVKIAGVKTKDGRTLTVLEDATAEDMKKAAGIKTGWVQSHTPQKISPGRISR